MLGHDWKMSCAKFQENRFRIDGEIDEKHALHIDCVILTVLLGICLPQVHLRTNRVHAAIFPSSANVHTTSVFD